MSATRRVWTGSVVVLVVVLLATATTWAYAAPLSLTSHVTLGTVSAPCLPSWWNVSYGYRAQITVTTGQSAVSTDYSVQVTLNHAGLVSAGHSLASGNDVRVVALNSATCTWTELDRVLDDGSGWNTATTRLWFRLSAAIGADSSSPVPYYLYYGNPAAAAPPANAMNVFLFFDDFPGTSLGPAWTVLRPPTTWSVSGNALHVTMQSQHDFWGSPGTNNTHNNINNNAPLFSVGDPSGDVEVRVLQSGNPSGNGQTTGILVYQGDDDYVATYREYTSQGCGCRGLDLVREVAAMPSSTWLSGGSNPLRLRLTRLGTTYTGTYSTNGGASYTTVGTISSPIAATRIGLTAFSYTNSTRSIDLTDFRIRRYTSPEPSTSLGAETPQY